MNERFTLIDYTYGYTPTETVIEEPVGWDAIALRIKRDTEWHGFFDFFDDSVSSLQFDADSGFDILQAAYQTDGALAKVELKIEFQCSEGADYQQLYLGRFVFSSYKETCGDRCFSTCGVEALNCLMTFRNRYDQQVDLDSLKSFDQPCETHTISYGSPAGVIDFRAPNEIIIGNYDLTEIQQGSTLTITGTASNNGTFTVNSIYSQVLGTVTETYIFLVEQTIAEELLCDTYSIDISCWEENNLTAYDGLNKEIELPAKTIRLTNVWKINRDETYLLNVFDYCPTCHSQLITFTPTIPDTQSEIVNTNTGTGITNYVELNKANPPDTFIEYVGNNLRCAGPAKMKINLSAHLIDSGCGMDWVLKASGWALIVVIDKEFNSPYTGQTTGPNQWVWRSHTNDLTISDEIDLTSFPEGTNVYVYFEAAIDNFVNTCGPSLKLDSGAIFQFYFDSVCDPTPANIYLINETLARCTEAITNDCMTVYSDYFGRTNAQPYPSDVNGCMGFRSITNGLKIRNAPSPNGFSTPRMTVSMKDCFDALNATDNIGMGLEDDPFRGGYGGGYKLIRVEPFDYFYQDTVLLTFDHIRTVNRDVDAALIFSKFKTGYQKYETWNANGLFDLFAGREYRTELSELKNELEKVCKFIASDYAIEITRRLYGTTTSDWRYDADIFFLCLTSGYTDLPITFVEGNSILIYEIGTLFAPSIGDTIALTGSTFNDGIGFVVTDTYLIYSDHSVQMRVITFDAANHVTFEQNKLGITVQDGSATYTGEVFFVPFGGGALTFATVIAPIAAGSVITVGGTSFNNGSLTILDDETAYTSTPFQAHTTILITSDPVTTEVAPNASLTSDAMLSVQQGIVNGSNVLFPESVINYEIAPSRNAMRWFKTILQSYRAFLYAKMKFTQGTGNIVGQGLVNDDNGCRIENQIIQEKMDIDLSLFNSPETNYPLFYPELVRFEYPLSYEQYLTIIANPYGLIGFQCGDKDVEYGWIEDMKYNPYHGSAEFSLRPKIVI